MTSAIQRSWAWSNVTPFGWPVVPEVYRMVATWSKEARGREGVPS